MVYQYKPTTEKNFLLTKIIIWLLFPPILVVAVTLSKVLGGIIFPKPYSVIIGFLYIIFALYWLFKEINLNLTFTITKNSVVRDFDFIWRTKKEINLSDIKEVELKINPFQKIFNVGTIVLHTLKDSNQKYKAGISIRDIKNPVEIYDHLRKMISGYSQ